LLPFRFCFYLQLLKKHQVSLNNNNNLTQLKA
jgi:hypothetical protein